MFNFHGITHLLEINGRFTWVGSVPVTLCNPRKATREDIMAGRAAPDGFAYRPRVYDSAAAAVQDAKEARGVTLCSSASCACRKLF